MVLLTLPFEPETMSSVKPALSFRGGIKFTSLEKRPHEENHCLFLGFPRQSTFRPPQKAVPIDSLLWEAPSYRSVDKRLLMKEAHIYFGEALFFADGKHLFLITCLLLQ